MRETAASKSLIEYIAKMIMNNHRKRPSDALGCAVLLLMMITMPSGSARAQTADENPLLYELLDRIELLEHELRQLRGDLELLQRERLQTRVQPPASDRGFDSDRAAESPVTVLPEGRDADIASSEPWDPSGPTLITAPEARDDSRFAAAEQGAYDLAFSRLRDGHYRQAAADFQAFIQRYPNSELIGDAYYWLGESYYVDRDFLQAKQAYLTLGSRYPDNPKLPDALLKLGYSYGELGDRAKARQVLEKLIGTFPASSAASLAEQHLQRLR